MSLGGGFAFPVFKESRLDVYKLLEHYEPDNANKVTIDTDENNDILIAYDTVFRYAVDELNFDFEMFTGQLNMGITQLFEGTPIEQILPGLELLGLGEVTLTEDIITEKEINYSYDINSDLSTGSLENKQTLSRINFLNTDIIITIEPSFEVKNTGVLVLEIKIPGMDETLKIDVKPGEGRSEYIANEDNKDFNVNAEGDFQFTFKVRGDNTTKVKTGDDIVCSIAFESRDEKPKYIAYGWFNYSRYEQVKADTLIANLYDYIPEIDSTFLLIKDPQFVFEVRSSLGVPLEFGLDSIYTETHNSGSETFNRSKSKPFSIKAAGKHGETAITELAPIGNSFFQEEGTEISKFIHTDLNALRFFYSFIAPEKDPKKDPIQFISSDAKVDIYGRLKVPLAFDAGSRLCYRDTIALEDFDTESLEDISSLELQFNYICHLPIGFYIDLYLLDESYHNILEENKIYQSVTIEKAATDADGVVTEEKTGKFSLKFNKDTETSITKLKDAKYLLFNYRSVKTRAEGEAIRLKANDYLSIKMGVVIDGKLIVNNQ
jgi:hypothetical protein